MIVALRRNRGVTPVPAIQSRRSKDELSVKLPAVLGKAVPPALKDILLQETRAGTTVRLEAAAVDKVSTPACNSCSLRLSSSPSARRASS